MKFTMQVCRRCGAVRDCEYTPQFCGKWLTHRGPLKHWWIVRKLESYLPERVTGGK